jgi:antitoxin PrlF
MKSTISSKGQITVPAAIREKLGLVSGTPVEFELREGGVLVRKSSGPLHPVDRLFGSLKLAKPVDALLEEMRGGKPHRMPSGRRRKRKA